MPEKKKNQKLSVEARDEKREIVVRLKRLEGQVRGLERMIEENADCEAVLVQFSAVKAAFEKVGVLVIGNAIRDCIKEEISDVSKLDKAIRVMEKYLTYLK